MPNHAIALDWVSAHCIKGIIRRLKNVGIIVVRYTYNGNDPTRPRQLFVVQHPNPIREVSLNDERNKRSHNANVYATEMRMREVIHIAKSSNQPIVDIGPSESSLNGLQQEDKISCTKLVLKFRIFPMISKTDLKFSGDVGHSGNCSYTRLSG